MTPPTMSVLPTLHPSATQLPSGPATGLRCRECGATYPLAPEHVCVECFGPLEVDYDLDALRRVTRKSVAAGPPSMWRYVGPLPAGHDEATRVSLGAGMTRLHRADNLGRELGMRRLWVKDDSGNPTHSFKDRVVSVALSAAREFGFTTVACASTGNLANAVAAHAAQANLGSVVLIPADLEAGKVVSGGLRRDAGCRRRHVRRREPALRRDRRGAAVGVRQRQPAPVLRRGVQDARLRGRRATRLAAARAGRGPDGLRVVADQGGQGVRRVRHAGAGRALAVRRLRRPGQWLCADLGGVPGRARRGDPGAARDDRKVAGNWQPSGWRVRAGLRAPDRRCGGGRAGRGDRGRHPAAGEHRGHLRRDRGRGDGGDAAPAARRWTARPGGRDRAAQHRRRAEDSGRGGAGGRPDRDDCPLPRGVSEGRTGVSVTVRVPTIMRGLTSGVAEVAVEGGTLAQVLAALDAAHPGTRGRVLDDGGRLRRFVNVYVGDEDVRFSSGLDTPTPAGTLVSIIPAVAGG